MHARSDEICAAARACVGAPYRHQGRSREVGIDCAGLPVVIGHELGLGDFDTTAYSRRPQPREFDREMARSGCQKIPYAEAAAGDILRTAEPDWPVHCMILDQDDRGRLWVIHASAYSRKVVREPFTRGIEGRVRSAWRFPEGS